MAFAAHVEHLVSEWGVLQTLRMGSFCHSMLLCQMIVGGYRVVIALLHRIDPFKILSRRTVMQRKPELASRRDCA